jgi:hypothetical protein
LSDTYSAIQALQASLRQLQGQVASSSTAAAVSSSGSSGSGLSWVWLSTQETVFSGSSPVAWTTYTSSQVPSSAVAVILQYYARPDDKGSFSDVGMSARAASGGAPVEFWRSQSQGTDTDTEGHGGIATVPCSGSSFQYEIDAYVTSPSIVLVGYIG